MPKKMSQQDYVINKGKLCIYCSSENLTIYTIGHDHDYNDACCYVVCENCGKQWLNTYELSGYFE